MTQHGRRFFVRELPEDGGAVNLAAVQAEHARVLRMTVGDAVVLFDESGLEAVGTIEQINLKQVTCTVSRTGTRTSVSSPKLTLALGLPKSAQLESALRMATELGVRVVRLCQTERSVPRWADDKQVARLSRLERIMQEAARQSERQGIPTVFAPAPLENVLGEVPEEAIRWAFHARSTTPAPRLEGLPAVIWIAIGPEGGFSDRELALLESHGFHLASLGTSILRVETAVAAALSVTLDRIRNAVDTP